jgi:type I restriction enzyme M protein
MTSTPPTSPATGTSRARLGSIIKAARDIMRKDAGLNGDLDRLPLLSWLLFLRAFDAEERQRRIIEGEDFRSALSPSYQWSTWADDERLTGDELIEFVNENLLPYLAELKSDLPGDPRNVLGQVFGGVRNKMASGYLFRELVNQVRKIDFTSNDDIHTMAYLYESLLKEVRDAAGDSGEFYTPRPVIRFVVEQSFPRLGESILDPACGTGGFLVEAFKELTEGKDVGIADEKVLWHSLRGIEKKSDPYLLCMMNLLLHGVQDPQIVHENALVRMLAEAGPASKVDLVLTNPPFGGEEENSVAARFPKGYQVRETAILFVKAVIDKLKPNGRCAIVLPNGFLFDDRSRKVREDLVTKCNLHTVVRLAQGVFEPYTKIPVNLLFFDRSGPTKEIWYYQIDPPEGRKGYAKTRVMRYEEFAECSAWWGGPERADRVESSKARCVPAADIIADNFNLDLAPLASADELTHRPPTELLSELIATEQEILSLLTSLQQDLESHE